MPSNTNVTGWVGWVYFAGILMMLRGIADAFLGISALVNESNRYLFFTNSDTGNELIVSTANIDTWGWVHLVAGLVILAAGFSLLHGSTWARVLAVFLAGISFLVNLAFIGVFPLWSIIAMVVNALIIYALVVHGDEARA